MKSVSKLWLIVGVVELATLIAGATYAITSYLTSSAQRANPPVVGFYGYYTLDLLRDGKLAGLLSVNGYTAQVWHHAWHGDFLGMKELNK